MKIVTPLLIMMLLSSVAEANQYSFDFKKSSLFNKHSLVISNQDDKRTISFSGCYEQVPAETSFFVQMKNGSKYYFDSKVFCQIGNKGSYWVNAGNEGRIPFKLKKGIMENAKSVVFKGVTYLPVSTSGFVEFSDMRELIVIYDVKTGETSYQISDEVMEQPKLNADMFGGVDGPKSEIPNLDKFDGN